MTSLELQRAHLLHHVLSHAQALPAALENTALRGESVHMRQVLAHAASHGTLSLRELQDAVLAGRLSPYSLHAEWLARLAAVCALQNATQNTKAQNNGERNAGSTATERTGAGNGGTADPAPGGADGVVADAGETTPGDDVDGDTEFALAALKLATPQLPPGEEVSRRMLRLEAELLHETGRRRELDALLAGSPELRLHYYGYLEIDSRSPFAGAGAAALTEQDWLEGFNRQFNDRGLLPVRLRKGPEAPFNRLEAAGPVPPADDDGPLVSVIMTTYKPVRDDVLQSARSILAQSWRRLELLIVDDASPAEHAAVLDELEALDGRVRLTRLETNGGTYRARNIGISQARGDLITGQDADDWSHPQRIEIQVRDLLEDPERPGNQVYTVNMTEDLVRIRRGYPVFIPSAPTLMVRASIMRELGGYLPARKAADNELRGRVAAYTGRPVEALREPLIFMRILPDSLSRADFRPGWQHPARRAFWSAYRTWHAHGSPEELRLSAEPEAPVHIPSRFTAPPEEPVELDVVVAADWCEDGRLQADMIEEIRTLLEDGRSVGVLHLESALHPALRARRFHRPLQDLINAGRVQAVLPDEAFHRVDLMLVRSPELLQFLPQGRCAFESRQVAVVAEQLPAEPGGRVTYLPQDCAEHSEEFFGHRPAWIPASPAVREALAAVPGAKLAEHDAVTPFDPSLWQGPRRPRRVRRPVVGAWAGTLPGEWPARPEAISSLLPTDGSTDVRLYGDPSLLVNLLGEEAVPPAWLSITPGTPRAAGGAEGAGDPGRRSFVRSVDFFLSFPQRGALRPQRPVLEALAAGCVVIMPPWAEPACGQAAVYAEPAEVPEMIRRFVEDPALWTEQSHRAAAFRAGSGPQDFLRLIDRLAAQDAAQRQEMMAG